MRVRASTMARSIRSSGARSCRPVDGRRAAAPGVCGSRDEPRRKRVSHRNRRRFLAHVEEGLGTKNLVADAMYRLYRTRSYYDHIAQDTVAMIVNDMVTLGALPLAVAMHLGAGSSDWFKRRAPRRGSRGRLAEGVRAGAMRVGRRGDADVERGRGAFHGRARGFGRSASSSRRAGSFARTFSLAMRSCCSRARAFTPMD